MASLVFMSTLSVLIGTFYRRRSRVRPPELTEQFPPAAFRRYFAHGEAACWRELLCRFGGEGGENLSPTATRTRTAYFSGNR
jgi:hypothetical protein